MISLMATTKMTDRSVLATCPLGISLRGTGLSPVSVRMPVIPMRERGERPMRALVVAATKAKAPSYAFAAAAAGAGAGTAEGAQHAANGQNAQQKKTQHGNWAFRGLEPWSDPA
jgi:hypothetical protein